MRLEAKPQPSAEPQVIIVKECTEAESQICSTSRLKCDCNYGGDVLLLLTALLSLGSLPAGVIEVLWATLRAKINEDTDHTHSTH